MTIPCGGGLASVPLLGTLECSYEHRRSSTELGVGEGFNGLPFLGAAFFLAVTGYCVPPPGIMGCYISRTTCLPIPIV